MSAPTDILAIEHENLLPAALIERALLDKEGQLTSCGALAVETGKRTERYPLDRFIVNEPSTSDTIDWSLFSQPFSSHQFDELWSRVSNYLAERDTYSSELHVGQDLEHYLPMLLKTETAWHNMAGQTLFIRPERFNPKSKEVWSILHAANFDCDPQRDGTHSEGVVIINFARRKVLLAGVHYAGEIKKAIFVVQNFLLPEKDVLPLHCAANADAEGAVCLFLGASGAGKTTLSADPERLLIGDDEHGWGEGTVFNLEAGCYAKCLNLSESSHPEIFQAIRFGALIENVVIDPETRLADYSDARLTDNSRACYPLSHIDQIFCPITASEPKTIIFLCRDLNGVLPAVARLSREAAAYHFLAGYSTRNHPEGNADGTIETVFSACFSAPFLPRPATLYADLFMQRLDEHDTQVYLVNTGCYGGSAGNGGQPISLALTRRILDAIHSGEILAAETNALQPLNLTIPTRLEGIDTALLDPRLAWPDASIYEQAAGAIAEQFVVNFQQYSVDNRIINAGPLGQTTLLRAP